MINLFKLSENDKKVVIAFCLIFILLFVIIGYIGMLIKKIMKIQGSKSDAMLKNVVEANYFETEGQLIRFGIKKNIRCFYKEARVPFFIMVGASALLLTYYIITSNWSYNIFNTTDGFGTLICEFKEWPRTEFFGIRIISGWPEVARAPVFVPQAWVSYVFVPVMAIGIVWFLVYTLAYISRSLRIYQIARGIFRKKLVPEEKPVLSDTIDN